MSTVSVTLEEAFSGDALDLSRWIPWYLPHWSSRQASRASYHVNDGELRLFVPPEQPLWCEDLHEPPLRVSAIQSGCFAGPLGSTIGQQPFRAGLTVREEQPVFRGHLQHYGQIEIRMRATIDAASMVACWLVGFEDEPDRSGEICIAEIFGSETEGDTTLVGMGIHPFRDPALTEEFRKTPLRLDVAKDHSYAVEWQRDRVTFLVDGEPVHAVEQSPAYPMQLMIGVFDFPRTPDLQTESALTPELIVSHVRGGSSKTA